MNLLIHVSNAYWLRTPTEVPKQGYLYYACTLKLSENCFDVTHKIFQIIGIVLMEAENISSSSYNNNNRKHQQLLKKKKRRQLTYHYYYIRLRRDEK